jgi:cytosine deaminase
VAVASDNTRDPFYGFGDLDMAEVFRESVRIGHLDLPVGDWPRAVTTIPAEIMKLAAGRIVVGASADLVIFRTRDWSEHLSRPRDRRIVLRAGRVLDAELPDYRELDRLFAPSTPQGEAA